MTHVQRRCPMFPPLRPSPSFPLRLPQPCLTPPYPLPRQVGLAGRTGSGKSTLVLALLSMVEAESGHILIDGVDIARLGLRHLRSKMSVIPQDPCVFSGSVRHNLDPFNTATDPELWEVGHGACVLAWVLTRCTGSSHGGMRHNLAPSELWEVRPTPWAPTQGRNEIGR